MDIKGFPFLSRDEFSGACHHLDRQYCRATLGPLRSRWKLRLCTALGSEFCVDGAYTTFVQITRPLEPILDHGLSLDLQHFSIAERATDTMLMPDQAMVDAEESDTVRDTPMTPPLVRLSNEAQAAMVNHTPCHEAARVVYEIHLHPTYRVPCLWFTLHNLPPDEPAFNVDTVFRRLVPDEYKDGLRGLGGVGGISADASRGSPRPGTRAKPS